MYNVQCWTKKPILTFAPFHINLKIKAEKLEKFKAGKEEAVSITELCKHWCWLIDR